MKYKDLATPVAQAKEILQSLKKTYPKMRAYLMIDNRFGQIEPGSAGSAAIKRFPKFFLDCPAKEKAIRMLAEISNEEKLKEQAEKRRELEEAAAHQTKAQSLTGELNHHVDNLDVDENAQISIRFDELDYEIIRALQKDPRVDQELTPKIASIQVVFGTLKKLSEKRIAPRDEMCHVEVNL